MSANIKSFCSLNFFKTIVLLFVKQLRICCDVFFLSFNIEVKQMLGIKTTVSLPSSREPLQPNLHDYLLYYKELIIDINSSKLFSNDANMISLLEICRS